MAELNIFHYLPLDSFIHRADGRIKLICMVLLSISISLTPKSLDLGILSFICLTISIAAKLPIKNLVNELRYFLFLILLVLVVNSLSVPGTTIFKLSLLTFTKEGLRSGILFGWRIILLVALSTALTATTTLAALKNAIEYLLRPVPWIPEAKIATMISLTFTLAPLIFDQASEMMDAQKARCVSKRKNPAIRIVYLVFPLFVQTFRRANEMVDAMESRCYSEKRTPAVLKTKPSDWAILVFSGVICWLVLR